MQHFKFSIPEKTLNPRICYSIASGYILQATRFRCSNLIFQLATLLDSSVTVHRNFPFFYTFITPPV